MQLTAVVITVMSMTPEQFVEAIGTGNIIHNSGDLFGDHLRAVQRVLKEWGEDEELQLAGLFHSIYGTEGFQDFQLSFDRRGDIKKLIGEVTVHALVPSRFCYTAIHPHHGVPLHKICWAKQCAADHHCLQSRVCSTGVKVLSQIG